MLAVSETHLRNLHQGTQSKVCIDGESIATCVDSTDSDSTDWTYSFSRQKAETLGPSTTIYQETISALFYWHILYFVKIFFLEWHILTEQF